MTTSAKKYVVEIHDEIGYTRDAFSLEELPEGLRQSIESNPEAGSWTYEDADVGTWEASLD